MSGAVKTLAWTIGIAGAFTALAAATPMLFREMDAFRVTRVEVTGARLLSAAEAMQTAGITDTSNVFDDARVWADALRAHALVLDVDVERRPPAALRFHIHETSPVAWVQLPQLAPIDARGRVLPVDPASMDLDLPVLARELRPGADSILDARGREVVDAWLAISTLDGALAADVSELAPARGGGVRITLETPARTELLLPAPPDARVLHQVRLVLDHIESDTAAAQPAGTSTVGARLDARYRDEIFVTMPTRRTR